MANRFRKLAETYRDRIYTFALYSLRRPEDAEDVTQEVLIKLWQNHEQLDPAGIGAWTMRVARNAIIDVTRRRQTRAGLITDDVDPDVMVRQAPSASDTSASVEMLEFNQLLRAALAEIAEPYRSILVMREIQDLAYNDIADALELPLNTVKVYLHRGRRMLRDALRDGSRP